MGDGDEDVDELVWGEAARGRCDGGENEGERDAVRGMQWLELAAARRGWERR